MKDFDYAFLVATVSGATIQIVDALPGAVSWIIQSIIGVLTIWYLIRKIKHVKK